MPPQIREQFIRASLAGNPPHMLITGPAGVGKTAAWRLVARQVLGPGGKQQVTFCRHAISLAKQVP